MSPVPKRTFRFTVALSLLLVACGSVRETTTTGAGSEEIPSSPAPTPYSGSGIAASCTPNVALGEPVAAPLPSFTCPSGWGSRARNSALPIAGRFTSAREMVDALCTQSDEPSAEPAVAGVDFTVSDVLAVPYDGEVTMHRRGTELWIRQTDGCTNTYDTALFVVPKNEEPHEQTCGASCE